jgi:hypothetical protein
MEQMTEQILYRLLAGRNENQRMEAKADANLREMKAEIRANNEKFEVFHDTLAF